jgi:hypothetical protein
VILQKKLLIDPGVLIFGMREGICGGKKGVRESMGMCGGRERKEGERMGMCGNSNLSH